MQTEQLIDELTEKMQAVAPASTPARIFMKWMLYAVVYAAGALFFLKVRPDFMDKLSYPPFLAEILSLTLVIASSLLSAALLAFPDMYQRTRAVFLPVVTFLVFVEVLVWEFIADSPPSPLPPHAMECLLCISALSLIPGAFIIYSIKKLASTHFYVSGLVATLAAFSIGALILRISEQTDSIAHLLHWHYLPMILAAIMGVFLGKLCLKW
jgi:hypothetical protein